MSRTSSPLRYPGGKACLYPIATEILRTNDLSQRAYIEPYSGGCGLALSLLFKGHVAQIHLNDIDRSVWAFWHSVLFETSELIGLIRNTPVSVSEWEKQRLVQQQKDSAATISLGFSTFFLNRTNRSGIIHSGGIIGGKSQNGAWKIDCRYNREELISRIKRISQYKNRIFIYNEDAEIFLNKIGSCITPNGIIYIDPPYFDKGSQLYKNFYRKNDHERIARLIASLQNPWFMTYDNVPTIQSLYSEYPNVELDIGYSVQTKRRGSEILVLSKDLSFPRDLTAVAH